MSELPDLSDWIKKEIKKFRKYKKYARTPAQMESADKIREMIFRKRDKTLPQYINHHK